MDDQQWYAEARQVLEHHGFAASRLDHLGSGAQSRCFGTGEVAVLLHRDENTEPTPTNGYDVVAWAANRAADAGMRTPRVLAVGDHPRPYAVMERARGVHAESHPRATENAPAWFGQVGEEVRKANLVRTQGFGPFVPDGNGGFSGRFATWPDYLDDWLATYLCVGGSTSDGERFVDLVLAQDIVTEADLDSVAATVRAARDWSVQSVLTHYDNRLANFVVDENGDHDGTNADKHQVAVLDWGLSSAGIGIGQELIKVFENFPLSMEHPAVSAFVHGFGLTAREGAAAIEDGRLMLVMDGVAMSYGWMNDPDRLSGIRAWMQTVRRSCVAW